MNICPICNAIDHEPGAKFCHVCGTDLFNNTVCRLEASVRMIAHSSKVTRPQGWGCEEDTCTSPLL